MGAAWKRWECRPAGCDPRRRAGLRSDPSDPARARQERFRPGMQIRGVRFRPLGPPDARIVRLQLNQISGDKPRGDSQISKTLHQQPCRVAARPRCASQGFPRTSGRPAPACAHSQFRLAPFDSSQARRLTVPLFCAGNFSKKRMKSAVRRVRRNDRVQGPWPAPARMRTGIPQLPAPERNRTGCNGDRSATRFTSTRNSFVFPGKRSARQAIVVRVQLPVEQMMCRGSDFEGIAENWRSTMQSAGATGSPGGRERSPFRTGTASGD